MKKHISLAILAAGIISAACAQTPQPDSTLKGLHPGLARYDQLKKDGKLGSGLYVVPASGEPKRLEPNVYRTANPVAVTAPANCNCMMPIDATFNVVPFSFSQGPDYRNDDDSSPQIALPFNFCFYGTQQNSVFINNNGNISFGQSYGMFSATGFPTNQVVMIAPFWADVDTRQIPSGLVYYKVTPTYMIVRWQTVGYYAMHVDKLNDFQLIITDGNDPILPAGSNVSFCYGDMQWTTGDASGGINGFGGTAATVGANKGDGINYIQMGTFDQAGGTYNGPLGAPSGIDWLDNQQFFFNACNTGPNNNIPPILSSQQVCDTLTVCVGDTLHFSATFFSPEAAQTTTPNLIAPGVIGLTLTNFIIGNTAQIGFDLIASAANAGYNTITITGTDDGNPAQTTSGTVVVFVVASPTNTFTSTPGNCGANIASATSNPAGGTGVYTYLWQPGGQVTQTISNLAPGSYTVTVTDASGCDVTDTITIPVTGNLSLTPAQTDVTCYGLTNGTANITVNSGTAPYTYTWNPNVSATGSANNLAANTYTVDVTDAAGCTGQQIFTITQPALVPLVATASADVNICTGATANISVAGSGGSGAPYTYTWLNNGNTNTSQTVSPVVTTTYTVTVADQCGTPHDTDSVTVFVHEFPVNSFVSDDSSGCAPFCITFTDLSTVSGDVVTQWSWDFGDGSPVSALQNPQHCYTAAGQYTVSLITQSANGCATTSTANNMITVYSQPVASFTFGPQPAVLSNPVITFTDQSTGGVNSWLWDFNDPGDPQSSSLQSPSHAYSDTGRFCPQLIVFGTDSSCSDTASDCLAISPEILIWVPNSFSPNNDTHNDIFMPQFNSIAYIETFEMLIFDRWGNLIFKTLDPTQGWDGRANGGSKIAQIDTYVYKITVKDIYNEDYDFIGHVNLIH